MIDLKELMIHIEDTSNSSSLNEVFYNPKSNEYFFWYDGYEPAEDEDLEDYYCSDEWRSISVNPFSSNLFESFIYTQNSQIQNRLFNIFHGKGKYRRIKDQFYNLGIMDEFYEFKNNYIKQLAIEWCKSNNIKYKE